MKKILQSVTERSRHGSTGRNHDLVMPFLRPALSRFGILVLLYLIQLFSSPEVYAVTPTISNVSGSLQTGQILTITGSNMINEDMTNWDPYFTAHPTAYGFEGASPSADSYCAVGPCGGVYDTTVKLMGNQSIKFNTHGASGANPPADNLTSYNAMSVSAGNNKWYRFYARWNLVSGSWPTNYIKMLYNLLNFYFEPAPSSTGMTTQMLAKGILPDVSTAYRQSIPSGPLQNNRWYLFEVHWHSASPFEWEAWMDGTKIFNATTNLTDSLGVILFGLVNLNGTTSDFSLDHWMDGFAVSSSRIYPACTIEISNNSTYGQGTVIYQEPIYLSDGSVQIKANLTGLGSGPYYLWVTNNRQEKSASYQLNTISPPKNLSVQ